MRIVVNSIGSLIIALVLIGIIVITTISYCLGWPEQIQFIGTIVSIIETIGLWNCIMTRC
jgi:hypothetical protein